MNEHELADLISRITKSVQIFLNLIVQVPLLKTFGKLC